MSIVSLWRCKRNRKRKKNSTSLIKKETTLNSFARPSVDECRSLLVGITTQAFNIGHPVLNTFNYLKLACPRMVRLKPCPILITIPGHTGNFFPSSMPPCTLFFIQFLIGLVAGLRTTSPTEVTTITQIMIVGPDDSLLRLVDTCMFYLVATKD